MKAIWKREMRGYFSTVTGYVFLGVFLTASSILFYLEILKPRSGNLPYFVSDMSFLWMLLSPILTMRLLAEERQKNIGTTIDICRRLGASREAIVIQLMSGFNLSRDEAVLFVNQKFA